MSLHRKLGGALAVVLAAACFSGGAPVRAAELDKYLPEDSEIVVTVNVRQVLDSDLFKKNGLAPAREALSSLDQVQDVLKDLGFDPFKDLDRITVAWPHGAEKDRGLLIAHGRFNLAKFKAKADDAMQNTPDALKAHKVPDGLGGQHIVYEVTASELENPVFVTLANDKTLLASPGKDYVVDALKRTAVKTAPPLKSKDIQALLEKMDDKQSVSVAAISAAIKKNLPADLPDTVSTVVDKLTAVGGGLTLTEDLKFELVVTARNADDARGLRDEADNGVKLALAGLAVLTRKGTGGNPALELTLEFVKSVKVSSKGQAVIIKGRISGETFEEALKKDKD
jgi:hypothetical protein